MSKKISQLTTASALSGVELFELVQSSTNKKQTAQQILAESLAVTASGTDTYTATLSPSISAYTTNHKYFIKFTNANSGASTLNLNGIGAISIVKSGSTALESGDIAAGQILMLIYDGTNFQIVGGSGGSSINTDVDLSSAEFVTDFVWNESSSRMTFTTFNNGGGVGATNTNETFGVDATENCIGVCSVSTSTSTAGGATIAFNLTSIVFGTGFSFVLKWRAALETLSDGTNTYTASIGFHDDGLSGDADDGCYFRYTHSVNSGKWEAVTRNNTVETAQDTGVTAAITNYKIFEVRVNSTGTSVEFYIDGVLTNTITTNIPTGVTRVTGCLMKIEKTAGSTARKFYADYLQLISNRNTSR